ncbi:MAG: preprotein translocase subunit SecG [Armatimonadota bacterium]
MCSVSGGADRVPLMVKVCRLALYSTWSCLGSTPASSTTTVNEASVSRTSTLGLQPERVPVAIHPRITSSLRRCNSALSCHSNSTCRLSPTRQIMFRRRPAGVQSGRMKVVVNILFVLLVVISVLFILVTVLFGSKSDVMSGGSGQIRTTFKGKAGFDDFVSRMTLYLGIAFMALCVIINVIQTRGWDR